MALHPIASRLLPLLRRQQIYIAIALAVQAIFWALRQPVDFFLTLLYTLTLCNILAPVVVHANLRLNTCTAARRWLMSAAILIVASPVGVLLSLAIVFWGVAPWYGEPPVTDFSLPAFVRFVRAGWKFPLLASLIVGAVIHLYHSATDRLEQRNRELQQQVEFEASQRELQEEELQRAREIQQSLMPKVIAQLPGFHIAGAWEPARVVGGDYYDVIQLSETKLALCIADVVGKGVSAALLMANVQATVRAFASESAAPAWLCSRVNSVLCSNIASGKFVTLFYGVLDAQRQTLLYTNAGHLAPILINSAGESRLLDTQGAVLGIFPDWKFEDRQVQLEAGDRLLLYTDGITEAMRADGEEFGEQRLLDTAITAAAAPPSRTIPHMLSTVHSFCDTTLHDDATLLTVAVTAAQLQSPQPAIAHQS